MLNNDSFYSKSFVIFIRHPEMLKLDGTPCNMEVHSKPQKDCSHPKIDVHTKIEIGGFCPKKLVNPRFPAIVSFFEYGLFRVELDSDDPICSDPDLSYRIDVNYSEFKWGSWRYLQKGIFLEKLNLALQLQNSSKDHILVIETELSTDSIEIVSPNISVPVRESRRTTGRRKERKEQDVTKTLQTIFSRRSRKYPPSIRRTTANLQSTIIRLGDR
jgi:hypothetical protein